MTAQSLSELLSAAPGPSSDAPDDRADMHHDGAQTRACKMCGHTKALVPGEWVFSRGVAIGLVCNACAKIRKREYDAEAKRTKAITDAALSNEPKAPKLDLGEQFVQREEQIALRATAMADRKDLPVAAGDSAKSTAPVRALDASRALRAGARALDEQAPAILARILSYALDPTSGHHEWALKMVGERILPAKMYAELGLSEAGVGGAGAHVKPQISINIMASAPTPAANPVVVIEGASNGSEESNSAHHG